MPLEVLFATLLVGLTMTAFDSFPALVYVVVALNAGSLSNWLILTLAFLVFYLWRGVTRALQ